MICADARFSGKYYPKHSTEPAALCIPSSFTKHIAEPHLYTWLPLQLLGEFADLCGPFGSALKTIRDELVSPVCCMLYRKTAVLT